MRKTLLIFAGCVSAFIGLTSIFVAAALDDPQATGQHSQYHLYSSREVSAFLSGNSNVVILDVRMQRLFEEAHVENARHIYLHDPDFAYEVRKLDIVLPIVVYDQATVPADETYTALRRAGFQRIIYMSDGFRGWQQNGFPTESGREKVPFDGSARGVIQKVAVQRHSNRPVHRP